MSVKRKKDLLLECMLSDPRPHVTWYKNGEKIEVNVILHNGNIFQRCAKRYGKTDKRQNMSILD